jgi:hypothetical protein
LGGNLDTDVGGGASELAHERRQRGAVAAPEVDNLRPRSDEAPPDFEDQPSHGRVLRDRAFQHVVEDAGDLLVERPAIVGDVTE